jgi:hypothetical protein
MQTLQFTVKTSKITIHTAATDSDTAVNIVLAFENAPMSALVSVYQDNPVPPVSGKYGAPLGRGSSNLDHDGIWKAKRVKLDEGGYDKGGAYWGLRFNGESIYAVQDGMGNIAYVDAANKAAALKTAAGA